MFCFFSEKIKENEKSLHLKTFFVKITFSNFSSQIAINKKVIRKGMVHSFSLLETFFSVWHRIKVFTWVSFASKTTEIFYFK